MAATNFAISLGAYLAINSISLFIGLRLYPVNLLFMILHIIIVAALYFVLGTKLKLLGKHWKNYLSVCGSLVVGWLAIPSFFLISLNSSFIWLWALESRLVGGNVIAYITGAILATLPSILTWLGMQYKSKRSQTDPRS